MDLIPNSNEMVNATESSAVNPLTKSFAPALMEAVAPEATSVKNAELS